MSSYTKNFNLNANQLKREKKFITPNADQKTIKNSRIAEASSISKFAKISTPVKDVLS